MCKGDETGKPASKPIETIPKEPTPSNATARGMNNSQTETTARVTTNKAHATDSHIHSSLGATPCMDLPKASAKLAAANKKQTLAQYRQTRDRHQFPQSAGSRIGGAGARGGPALSARIRRLGKGTVDCRGRGIIRAFKKIS